MEFYVAMHLIEMVRKGKPLPNVLPPEVVKSLTMSSQNDMLQQQRQRVKNFYWQLTIHTF